MGRDNVPTKNCAAIPLFNQEEPMKKHKPNKRKPWVGMYLWYIDGYYLVLTRRKNSEDAIKKSRLLGAACTGVEHLGYVDA